MARPKIDSFLFRESIMRELAAQSFADLTNEHHARVFLSNVWPVRYLGCQQHDERGGRARIAFDLLLDTACTKARINSIFKNLKDPPVAYAIDSVNVSSADFYRWPGSENSFRVVTICLSSTARLAIADGRGLYETDTPYIKLYLD